MARASSIGHALAGLVAAALFAVAGTASALTPQEISEGFANGVIVCLKAVEAGGSVADLPEASRAGLEPSSAGQKAMLGPDADSPAWDVAPAKGVVMVFEPKRGGCRVMAYGPPVQLTFQETVGRARAAYPDFANSPLTAGYDPIVAGLERTAGVNRLVVELRGAEPGTPGHTFRFSTLSAVVRHVPLENAQGQ